MSDDLITESLSLAAERGGDITATVYEKYFQHSPESAALMAHIDDLARGKMMDEIYRLVMVTDYSAEAGYLNWEVDNHEKAYSVESSMYDGLFSALIETVREVLGSDWNDQFERAWQERLQQLEKEIVSRFGASA